jgi:hypothetical protein
MLLNGVKMRDHVVLFMTFCISVIVIVLFTVIMYLVNVYLGDRNEIQAAERSQSLQQQDEGEKS